MEIFLGIFIVFGGILLIAFLRSLTTLFHELGHALLSRDHLNSAFPNGKAKSIMCSGTDGVCSNFTTYYDNEILKGYYLDVIRTCSCNYTYKLVLIWVMVMSYIKSPLSGLHMIYPTETYAPFDDLMSNDPHFTERFLSD